MSEGHIDFIKKAANVVRFIVTVADSDGKTWYLNLNGDDFSLKTNTTEATLFLSLSEVYPWFNTLMALDTGYKSDHYENREVKFTNCSILYSDGPWWLILKTDTLPKVKKKHVHFNLMAMRGQEVKENDVYFLTTTQCHNSNLVISYYSGAQVDSHNSPLFHTDITEARIFNSIEEAELKGKELLDNNLALIQAYDNVFKWIELDGLVVMRRTKDTPNMVFIKEVENLNSKQSMEIEEQLRAVDITNGIIATFFGPNKQLPLIKIEEIFSKTNPLDGFEFVQEVFKANQYNINSQHILRVAIEGHLSEHDTKIMTKVFNKKGYYFSNQNKLSGSSAYSLVIIYSL